MTITELTTILMNKDRYQHHGLEQFANHSNTPPAGHKYYEDGMDITGMKASDFKTIPVSKEMEQKMKDIAFDQMKNYYGMTGEGSGEMAEAIKSYYSQIPKGDRIHAARTLDKIHRAEANRLNDFVRSRVPGWEPGKPFDTSILDEYRQGIDTKA